MQCGSPDVLPCALHYIVPRFEKSHRPSSAIALFQAIVFAGRLLPRNLPHQHQTKIPLTLLAGSHEGLYIARARHGSVEQEGRLPRNQGLMLKALAPAA